MSRRRSVSLEPEIASLASPRRSTRLAHLRCDSPMATTKTLSQNEEKKPMPRTRRSMSTQDTYESDLTDKNTKDTKLITRRSTRSSITKDKNDHSPEVKTTERKNIRSQSQSPTTVTVKAVNSRVPVKKRLTITDKIHDLVEKSLDIISETEEISSKEKDLENNNSKKVVTNDDKNENTKTKKTIMETDESDNEKKSSKSNTPVKETQILDSETNESDNEQLVKKIKTPDKEIKKPVTEIDESDKDKSYSTTISSVKENKMSHSETKDRTPTNQTKKSVRDIDQNVIVSNVDKTKERIMEEQANNTEENEESILENNKSDYSDKLNEKSIKENEESDSEKIDLAISFEDEKMNKSIINQNLNKSETVNDTMDFLDQQNVKSRESLVKDVSQEAAVEKSDSIIRKINVENEKIILLEEVESQMEKSPFKTQQEPIILLENIEFKTKESPTKTSQKLNVDKIKENEKQNENIEKEIQIEKEASQQLKHSTSANECTSVIKSTVTTVEEKMDISQIEDKYEAYDDKSVELKQDKNILNTSRKSISSNITVESFNESMDDIKNKSLEYTINFAAKDLSKDLSITESLTNTSINVNKSIEENKENSINILNDQQNNSIKPFELPESPSVTEKPVDNLSEIVKNDVVFNKIDETNISIVDSTSPDSTEKSNQMELQFGDQEEKEYEYNLSLVNDDGQSYSPIRKAADSTIIVNDIQELNKMDVKTPKGLKKTPKKDRMSGQLTPITKSVTIKEKMSTKKEQNEENTNQEAVNTSVTSLSSKMGKGDNEKKLLQRKRKRVSDDDELENEINSPIRKKKKINQTLRINFSNSSLDDEEEILEISSGEEASLLEEEESENELDSFFDNEAMEGDEDTPSDDSNQIIDKGESVGSSSENSSDVSDDADEMDSFIVDDDVEDEELLSGTEDFLGTKPKDESVCWAGKKKRRRIIDQSSDEELDKMSTRPFGGFSSGGSLISVSKISSVDSDNESLIRRNEALSKMIEENVKIKDDTKSRKNEESDDDVIEVVVDSGDEKAKEKVNKTLEVIEEMKNEETINKTPKEKTYSLNTTQEIIKSNKKMEDDIIIQSPKRKRKNVISENEEILKEVKLNRSLDKNSTISDETVTLSKRKDEIDLESSKTEDMNGSFKKLDKNSVVNDSDDNYDINKDKYLNFVFVKPRKSIDLNDSPNKVKTVQLTPKMEKQNKVEKQLTPKHQQSILKQKERFEKPKSFDVEIVDIKFENKNVKEKSPKHLKSVEIKTDIIKETVIENDITDIEESVEQIETLKLNTEIDKTPKQKSKNKKDGKPNVSFDVERIEENTEKKRLPKTPKIRSSISDSFTTVNESIIFETDIKKSTPNKKSKRKSIQETWEVEENDNSKSENKMVNISAFQVIENEPKEKINNQKPISNLEETDKIDNDSNTGKFVRSPMIQKELTESTKSPKQKKRSSLSTTYSLENDTEIGKYVLSPIFKESKYSGNIENNADIKFVRSPIFTEMSKEKGELKPYKKKRSISFEEKMVFNDADLSNKNPVLKEEKVNLNIEIETTKEINKKHKQKKQKRLPEITDSVPQQQEEHESKDKKKKQKTVVENEYSDSLGTITLRNNKKVKKLSEASVDIHTLAQNLLENENKLKKREKKSTQDGTEDKTDILEQKTGFQVERIKKVKPTLSEFSSMLKPQYSSMKRGHIKPSGFGFTNSSETKIEDISTTSRKIKKKEKKMKYSNLNMKIISASLCGQTKFSSFKEELLHGKNVKRIDVSEMLKKNLYKRH